ncbi:MAG: anthranilate synthase component I, partial [Methylocella sp.]
MFEPSLEVCARSYAAGQPCLVSARLAGDLETPVSAFLKLSVRRTGRIFLLESVEGGAARGRFSMIGLDPDIVWRVYGGKAEINRQALADPENFSPCAEPALAALRELIAESRIETPDDLPPMAAGVFGYLGYDMVRLMERLAEAKPDPIGVPDALMLRPTVMVVFDAVRDEIFVVTPLRPDRNSAFRAAHD